MRERKREREERLVVLVVSARVCCVYVLAISWASYRQGSLSSIDRSAGGGEQQQQQQQQQQQPTEPITNAISERTFIGLTAPSPPIDDFSAICLQRR